MLGRPGIFFVAIPLLLAMVQARARLPSAMNAHQVIAPAASTIAAGFSRERSGNTLPAENPDEATLGTTGADEPAVRDCDGLPREEKEACYAEYDEAALKECERLRLHGCAPYARVYRAEAELRHVGDALLRHVRDAYASYEQNQPGYIRDVEDAYAVADSAWRDYRDAHCALDPIVQGMSRQEAPGLAADCRANMTEARVRALRKQTSLLFEEVASDDRPE